MRRKEQRLRFAPFRPPRREIRAHRVHGPLVLAMLVDAGLAALLAVRPATGQTLPMRHFTVREGLAQSQITGLYQDPRGYLWISTLSGLSRFDGRKFLTYTTLDGMPDDVVTALTGDERGAVWCGTDSGHLAVWNREKITSPPVERHPSGGAILGLASLSGERMAAVTPTSLDIFDTSGNVIDELPIHVRSVQQVPGRGCWLLADAVYWLGVGADAPRPWAADDLLRDRIAAVARTDARDYVALEDGSLMSRTPGGPWRLLASSGMRGVRTLLASSQGEVWVGADSGLWLLPRGGTGRAVRLHADGGTTSVRALLEDREGNLWIGTWGDGLYQLTSRAFTVLDRSAGLASDSAWALHEDGDHCMWIATEDAGVIRWCKGGIAQTLRPGLELPTGRAMALAGGEDGALYIGTANGLARWRRGEGVRFWTTRDGLPDNYVTAVETGAGEGLWVATQGGLAHLTRAAIRSWTRADGLPDDNLRGIALDRSGSVWIASHTSGLLRFDGHRFERFGSGQGPPRERVWCVTVDSRDTVWAGTDGGIFTRAAGGGGERHIGVEDGLPSQNVLFVVEDAEGMMWAGTTRGVARISPVGEVLRVLTASDGLSSPESAEGAATLSANGRLWLGMASGITIVDPHRLSANPYPPLLAIEALSVNGKPWGEPFPIASGTPSPEPFLHLPPGSEEVRFDFVALSLTSPEKVRYRYQLEGFEEHATVSQDTHVTYRGLRSGRYRFVLTAENNDGVWTYEPLTATLTVRPFWHATWWFRGLMLGALVFGSAAVVTGRIRQHRRRRDLLERQVTARTAELNAAYRRIAEQNTMLQALSRTDPLTGLANRRVMEEQLPTEMAVRRREALRRVSTEAEGLRGSALYMLDLDHFKSVNDRFGHEAGDRFLVDLARAIAAALREVDLAVRWGGEELLVLARGVDPAGAVQVARRLLKAVADTRVAVEDGDEVSLTASVGFVPYPLAAGGFLASSDWLRLVEAADRLLYLAKSQGRSRACGLRWAAGAPSELQESAILSSIMADPEAELPGLEHVTEPFPQP